jgi:uncharacterized protein YjbI with pentapeptide repeats
LLILGLLAGFLIAAAPLTLAGWSRVWGAADRLPEAGWLSGAVGLALGGATLLLAALWRPPATHLRRRPIRVLSGWLVLAGVVIAVLAGVSVTAWLLAEANQATSGRAQARIDAIRTGLTAGAGVGGGIALLLAARREWLGERGQAHTEDDAAERRITELYTKAADQLGHDKAAVRLAGLYALERLGQSNPDHRQTIVNVLCAYLRMPPPDADSGAAAESPEARRSREHDSGGESQVRLTAQRILTEHLLVSDAPFGSTFWRGMDLDLAGATLVDLDLSWCGFGTGTFTRARFVGTTAFDHARSQNVSFNEAEFVGDVSFGNAVFSSANFFRARFGDMASFKTFESGVLFSGAQFCGAADFTASVLRPFVTKAISFDGVQFDGKADFSEVTFVGAASFDRAGFGEGASFWLAQFGRGGTRAGARARTVVDAAPKPPAEELEKAPAHRPG